jgi:hypothetical protein
MAAHIAEGVEISDDMQNMIIEAVVEVTAGYRLNKTREEGMRLAVEVVCLMRQLGYTVKDSMVLEVIELCETVADCN